MLQDSRVEVAAAGPSLLQVLPAHVLLESRPHILPLANPPHCLKHDPDLLFEGGIGCDQVLLSGALEIQAVQGQKPGQFIDRIVVMVDPKIEVTVVVPPISGPGLGDQQGRRLLAATISAFSLRGPERIHQPVGQGLAGRALERLGHGRHHVRRRQDVALARESGPGERRGVLEASASGERGCLTRRVHDPDLAMLPTFVEAEETIQHRLRLEPCRQEVQAAGTEGGVGERLGRDGPHVAPGPRHDRADRQEFGLGGHAHLVGRGFGGDDRVCHSYLTRGSRNAYTTSTTRFATTMNTAARIVTPMTTGKSLVNSDWMLSWPTPCRLNTFSTMMAPPSRYPRSIPKRVTMGVMATRTPWPRITRRSESPLARAVRMKSSCMVSIRLLRRMRA